MDLDLDDLPIRTLGRAPKPPDVEIIGPIEESDVAMLATGARAAGSSPGIKLKDRHHSVARLLAAGHKPFEVCAITGYSASHISLLQGDPAFEELLAFYRAHEDAAGADLTQRLKDAAATAVAKLSDRIESDEEIEFSDLSKATRDLLDRAGHSPKLTKDVNITIGLAERVEQARRRAIELRRAPKELQPPDVLELQAEE
jgi:hypothetical protein